MKESGYALLNVLVGLAVVMLGGLGFYVHRLDVRIDALGQNLGSRIEAQGQRIDAVEQNLGSRIDEWARLFHEEQTETRAAVAELRGELHAQMHEE